MLNSLKFHNIIHSPDSMNEVENYNWNLMCLVVGSSAFVRHARTDRELRNIQHDVRRNSLSLSRISRVITLSAVMQTYQWIVDSMIDQFTCEFSNKEKIVLQFYMPFLSTDHCSSVNFPCQFFAFATIQFPLTAFSLLAFFSHTEYWDCRNFHSAVLSSPSSILVRSQMEFA